MFDRNLLKLPGMHAVMAALAILSLLRASAIAGQALFLGDAISNLWAGEAVEALVPQISGFFACFAVRELLGFAQETMLDRYSLGQAASLRERMLSLVFDPRSVLAQSEGAALVATTATEGIDDVQEYVRIIPPKVVGMALVSIPLLIVVFAVDWVSGVVLAVMFPVIIFFMVLLGKQSRDRAERQYGAYTRLSNRFMDTLRGMEVVKAFDAARHEEDSVYRYSEKLRQATVKTLTSATLSSAVLDLCATFGVAAVAMMLAFRLMDGSIALSPALTALMLAPEYFAPIRSFASDFHASLDGKNALSAVLGMLERAHGGDDAGADGAGQAAIAHALTWDERSTLEFRDVSYRYETGETGLDGVNATFEGFEHVALVGRSGSGKSTFAKLLSGFIAPTGGTVLVNGKPFDLADAAWKSLVRIIPQNPYIFRMSLADNVRFYRPDATDAQVRDAIAAVGLDNFAESLPDGIDTLVGEGLRGLSGGQAHRIALARVLLDDRAQILVFDEPTAHLDIETELELKQSMLPLMKGKMVVFATHRLHWTKNMDRVVLLGSGRVNEEADHG